MCSHPCGAHLVYVQTGACRDALRVNSIEVEHLPHPEMKDMNMDFLNLAKGMLADKIGGDSDAIGGVMNSLIGGGDKLDIGGLVNGLKEKGLGDVASSWLGDGANADISADQLKDVLGGEQVAQAAAKLGTDEGSLLNGLKDALPQLVDKASNGGSLLDSVGGIGGLAGMAKKFL